jgi:hypothetical protein
MNALKRYMLNLKKEAESVQTDELVLGTCPACSSYVSHLYFMRNAETKKESRWYSCSCGVVWQGRVPMGKREPFDASDKKLKDAYEYIVRLYAPIIEEAIYGRKAVVVGHATDHIQATLTHRGWICGALEDGFDTYDFGTEKLSLLIFYHSLESFSDPIAVLRKAKSLLTEDGILFIAGPDTDFINTRGSSRFRYWRPDTHYIMWNRRAITKQLESLGFNVLMARQNCWMRFPETDDFHMIAQCKFF